MMWQLLYSILSKKGKTLERGAKANIKYIENRKGKDGAKIQRPLFGANGTMSRLQANEMVDQAEAGSTFFRIKISPDPAKEDREHDLLLREITAKTMDIEEKLGKQIAWIAAIHDDHTDKRHVHVLAIAKARLLPAPHMIEKATQASLEQRQELDRAREHKQKEKERSEAQWERQR